jgi:hypothetical protein
MAVYLTTLISIKHSVYREGSPVGHFLPDVEALMDRVSSLNHQPLISQVRSTKIIPPHSRLIQFTRNKLPLVLISTKTSYPKRTCHGGPSSPQIHDQHGTKIHSDYPYTVSTLCERHFHDGRVRQLHDGWSEHFALVHRLLPPQHCHPYSGLFKCLGRKCNRRPRLWPGYQRSRTKACHAHCVVNHHHRSNSSNRRTEHRHVHFQPVLDRDRGWCLLRCVSDLLGGGTPHEVASLGLWNFHGFLLRWYVAYFCVRDMAPFLTDTPPGGLVAAAITYATGKWESTWAWRMPSAFQGLFAILSIAILPFILESPHWLLYKGRRQEALEVLAQIHADGDVEAPAVLARFKEIDVVGNLTLALACPVR